MTQDFSESKFPLLTTSGESISKFKFNSVTENTNDTSESEFGAKVNIRVPFTVVPSQKGRLRAGLRLRIKEKSRDNKFFAYEPVNSGMEFLPDVSSVTFDGQGFNLVA